MRPGASIIKIAKPCANSTRFSWLIDGFLCIKRGQLIARDTYIYVILSILNQLLTINREIKHDFTLINIRKVPREAYAQTKKMLAHIIM